MVTREYIDTLFSDQKLFQSDRIEEESSKRNNILRVAVKYGFHLKKKILLDSFRANLLTVFS